MLGMLNGRGRACACATPPSRIPAAAVPTAKYDGASCEALARELETLGLVERDQRTARNWDIALNWLLLPGIGAATGDSEK